MYIFFPTTLLSPITIMFQPQLDLNEMEYGMQEEDLKELEPSFAVLEMECQQIHDRRELEEKMEIEQKVQHFRMTKAAILIQGRWRAYRATKKQAKGKKGKKGKGKKGKKGKKAKKG